MAYEVKLHPKANDFLERVEENIKHRIREKPKELRYGPEKGKKLKYSDFWRLRVGDYRIIYEMDYQKSRVIVLFIGHRKDVYDDFSKII